MRDRTIIRLWYLRSKQILNLSGRSTGIIIIIISLAAAATAAALKMGPICNQDCDADACGISRAGISHEKGLS